MQILASVLGVLVVVVAVVLFVNRPLQVEVRGEVPANFPEQGFSHQLFEDLLAEFADEAGEVAYERWHKDAAAVARLDSYLAAVARYSPDATPERFSGRHASLAFWMSAYNAYVIRSVLEHWPVRSVTDVRAPFEIVKGFGFFYRQRFAFGGESLSLYEVENDRIRKRYRDPRIHFLLNCGSESCPVLPPQISPDSDLDRQLDEATVAFVSDPANVTIDHAEKRLAVSRIFKWYRDDFIADLLARGLPSSGGLLLYLQTVAPEPLAQQLALAGDYELEFHEYDWSLNDAQQ